MNDELLFTLRVRTSQGMVVVRAFEAGCVGHRVRVDIEVRCGGRVIFPRGQLWVGISPFNSIDGKHARAAVLSSVGMQIGDTDRDYFDGYTNAQLEFAASVGAEICLAASDRYGHF